MQGAKMKRLMSTLAAVITILGFVTTSNAAPKKKTSSDEVTPIKGAIKACAYTFSDLAAARQPVEAGMVVPVPQSWQMADCLVMAKKLSATGSGQRGFSITGFLPACILDRPVDGELVQLRRTGVVWVPIETPSGPQWTAALPTTIDQCRWKLSR